MQEVNQCAVTEFIVSGFAPTPGSILCSSPPFQSFTCYSLWTTSSLLINLIHQDSRLQMSVVLSMLEVCYSTATVP